MAALGGAAAARLLHRLAMPVSPDTVLRLIRGLPLPVPEPPRVVGVDDWALRKGRTYGTIVVDLERRRVVGLLPDRASTTVADWLRQRPIRRCGAGQPMRPVALSPLRSVCEAAGGGADLDAWLAEAHACGIGAVETFAAGLEKDGAAVRAALTEPWSSGQAEGQINRLKLLKRQSYGRASFDLLRQRVLMAA